MHMVGTVSIRYSAGVPSCMCLLVIDLKLYYYHDSLARYHTMYNFLVTKMGIIFSQKWDLQSVTEGSVWNAVCNKNLFLFPGENNLIIIIIISTWLLINTLQCTQYTIDSD